MFTSCLKKYIPVVSVIQRMFKEIQIIFIFLFFIKKKTQSFNLHNIKLGPIDCRLLKMLEVLNS